MRILLPLNDTFLKSLVEPFVYGHVSLGYDLVVTYIEACAKARGALRALTDEDSEHLDKVIQESTANQQLAEAYKSERLEDIFPEFCKEIQHRRANYAIVLAQRNMVKDQLAKGLILDNQAQIVLDELDKRYKKLQFSRPKLGLSDHKMRAILHPELKAIFGHDDLIILEDELEKEQLLMPNQGIMQKDQLVSKIWYVTRGRVIENNGQDSTKLDKGITWT